MENANISVIDMQSADTLTDPYAPFMLVLHKGENILQSILECAQILNLDGASFMGVGALEDPTIAYFDLPQKKYKDKTFAGIYELISFNGNIAQMDNKHLIHAHVALGDHQYQVIGGHLQNAIVGLTAEITIIPFKGSVNRSFNEKLGLNLIKPN